jgi:hypothetical protein
LLRRCAPRNVGPSGEQRGDLVEIAGDMPDAKRAQPLFMVRPAMAAGDKADHRRARRQGALHAHRRILDDRDLADRHPKRRRGVKIKVGRRLAARDMLAAGKDPVLERAFEADIAQMTLDPVARA